jgi:decaprenylphospho-beta-D-erythro-pentofuranosid-2-ulose 2-reductase
MAYLLILGARSDIARAVAHVFAKKGFDLYLAARKHGELESDVQDLQIRYGIKAEALEFDALKFESHLGFYESLKEKPLGTICAVGYLGDQKKAEQDFDEAKKIIDTNYSGCVSILSVISNDFAVRGGGFIIGLSSVAGDRGRRSNYYYGSAKSALTTYLSGLRNRLAQVPVSVMTVKLGFVRTKMTENLDLPGLLTATPDEVAVDIYKGWRKGKDIIYSRWYWKFILLVIKIIPERRFKKLSL